MGTAYHGGQSLDSVQRRGGEALPGGGLRQPPESESNPKEPHG
jgi:hypothetical protein